MSWASSEHYMCVQLRLHLHYRGTSEDRGIPELHSDVFLQQKTLDSSNVFSVDLEFAFVCLGGMAGN